MRSGSGACGHTMEFLREAAVLTAPDETYVRARTSRRRVPEQAKRRDFVEDPAEVEADGGYNSGRRRTGLRLTFAGGVPESMWGRVAAGLALLAIIGVGWAAAVIAQRMVLHDERFVLSSGSSIVTGGNHHLSRAQLISVFGGDIERNILRVSLDERKAELEEIPWVKHATVMRLLPDHINVVVEERTPIAFVRQGGHIGLVDASGVLMGLEGNTSDDIGYSFPVVTGIAPEDPLSVRAARMKLFQDFTRDLDAKGEKISAKFSEIDLSNPEDIKTLIPDHGTDVLVHFGDSDYLNRYKSYEAHLSGWRSQYPKLSSVDMRYERQVVLEMQPGSAVPLREVGGGGKLPVSGAAMKEVKGKAVPLAKAHAIGGSLPPSHESRASAGVKVPTQALVHGARKADHP